MFWIAAAARTWSRVDDGQHGGVWTCEAVMEDVLVDRREGVHESIEAAAYGEAT